MLRRHPVAVGSHHTQTQPASKQHPRRGSVLARLGPRARIAVLRTGRLGDLLVLTPALRSLRAAAPHAHVTLLVKARALPLAVRLRGVDEVVEVPDRSSMQ